MASLLHSICRVAALATLLSSSALAQLRERYPLKDGGQERTFVIARDEVDSRDARKRSRKITLAGRTTAEAVRRAAVDQSRATGEEVNLVLYEEGQPHNEFTRRVLTCRIAVELRAGQDAAALAKKLGLTDRGELPYAPGWHILEAAQSGGTLEALDALLAEPGIVSAEPQLARLRQKRLVPDDPLFASQWHLRNTGQNGIPAGIDANVVPVWDTWRGAGIRIGIVDNGLQTTHPDLAPNVDTVNGHNWNAGDANDPNPIVTADFHGTSCAGVAAARGNNGLGVSGAAPEATLVGLRLIAQPGSTDQEDAEAMNWKSNLIQIKSNSWGPTLPFNGPDVLCTAAIKNAAETGRGGLGTIFLWAAGNDALSGDNSNYDGFSNSIYAIGVGAIDSNGQHSYYSEPGANLLISAPSNGAALGITTTDLVGDFGYNSGSVIPDKDYTNDFGGTSSATPLTAGVVALLLQSKPMLGWRDVQEILIRSATKIAPADTDWVTNAAGFHFNHKYGAGLVNAQAAVNLAATWTNLGTHQNVSSAQTGLNVAIPDYNTGGITRTFNLSSSNIRVEHVTVKLSITHPNRGDLAVTLTSPSGTTSRLAETHSDTNNNYASWTFSTVHSWGEPSTGVWTLNITDNTVLNTGTLTSATLTVFGGPGNMPPSVSAATISPAGTVFFDQTLTVGGITATDPEGDAFTFGYQWQQSADGVSYANINGATSATLALAAAQSGQIVRCAVSGISFAGVRGAFFLTNAVAVNRRPLEVARDGQPYSYDSDLFPTGAAFASRPLIINEISQGAGGGKEWVELLVLQTADLRGFSLHDSTSTFVTFVNTSAWAMVPAGTLIVIYNSNDRDTSLPGDDLDFSDGVLIVPMNETSLFTGNNWPGLSNGSGENVNIRNASNALVDGVSFNGNAAYVPVLGAVGAAKAAAYLGGSESDAEISGNWSTINASAATPGAANGATNANFVSALRAGSAFRLGASGDTVPGLTIDPATGVLSGTPVVPGGGLFHLVIERAGASLVTQTFPLLVADAGGHYVVPAGQTLTLDHDLLVPGNLSVLGTLNTAGFSLSVQGTIAVAPNATMLNGTGTIGYLQRAGPSLPGSTALLVDAVNDLSDLDGDGSPALLEFKLGTDPSENSFTGLPAFTRVDGHLTLTYSTPIGASGVNATVEVSSDLLSWENGPAATEVISDTTTNNVRTLVVRDLSTASPRYIRLKVSR